MDLHAEPNGISAPCRRPGPVAYEDDEENLDMLERRRFRKLAAAANHLAQGRADLQYAVKELSVACLHLLGET